MEGKVETYIMVAESYKKRLIENQRVDERTVLKYIFDEV